MGQVANIRSNHRMKNIDYKLQITKQKRGFTLIELLVVISIIGILAALATVSFTSSQKQARDTKRKSDLRWYQNAVEILADKKNGMYPMWYTGLNASAEQFCFGTLGLPQGTCPVDPKFNADNTYFYHYQSDGDNNDGSLKAIKYILWSKTENVEGYWFLCSSGTVSSSTSQPNINSCP